MQWCAVSIKLKKQVPDSCWTSMRAWSCFNCDSSRKHAVNLIDHSTASIKLCLRHSEDEMNKNRRNNLFIPNSHRMVVWFKFCNYRKHVIFMINLFAEICTQFFLQKTRNRWRKTWFRLHKIFQCAVYFHFSQKVRVRDFDQMKIAFHYNCCN